MRVPGHSLRTEGKPYVVTLGGSTVRAAGGSMGRGLCECTALSEIVATDAARKRWHREHKEALRG